MYDEDGGAALGTDSWGKRGLARGGGVAYGVLIENMRQFLDTLAAARPEEADIEALAADLQRWSERLAPAAVGEDEQIFGHRSDLPGRGTTILPPFVLRESDENSVRGTFTCGRYFLGGGGAVHGGVLPMLFDDVLGSLAHAGGRSRARTAYLHVEYRAITPLDTELELRGWFEKESGRKRLMRGEVRHGDTVCVEIEALFVALRPGQP